MLYLWNSSGGIGNDVTYFIKFYDEIKLTKTTIFFGSKLPIIAFSCRISKLFLYHDKYQISPILFSCITIRTHIIKSKLRYFKSVYILCVKILIKKRKLSRSYWYMLNTMYLVRNLKLEIGMNRDYMLSYILQNRSCLIKC